jgi:hypothetical protein
MFEAAAVTGRDLPPAAPVGRIASSQSLTVSPAAAAAAPVPRVPSSHSLASADEGGQLGVFVTAHRPLLNALVRQSPGLLDGALGVLVRMKNALDFDNKRMWFRAQVRVSLFSSSLSVSC